VTADPNCLFCRIVAGEVPSDQVRSDDVVLAIRDIAPRAPTHVLLMPRDHIPSVADLAADDGAMLAAIFTMATAIARDEAIADDGYRIVTNVGRYGGQTVDHLHFHLMGGRPFSWPPG
jgi:histidine triad (HIT) family protein